MVSFRGGGAGGGEVRAEENEAEKNKMIKEEERIKKIK
jgi:hypothetical protein